MKSCRKFWSISFKIRNDVRHVCQKKWLTRKFLLTRWLTDKLAMTSNARWELTRKFLRQSSDLPIDMQTVTIYTVTRHDTSWKKRCARRRRETIATVRAFVKKEIRFARRRRTEWRRIEEEYFWREDQLAHIWGGSVIVREKRCCFDEKLYFTYI